MPFLITLFIFGLVTGPGAYAARSTDVKAPKVSDLLDTITEAKAAICERCQSTAQNNDLWTDGPREVRQETASLGVTAKKGEQKGEGSSDSGH